ncbi:MAG: hypothetical protein ABIQ35_07105, partial [Verrucomicrobiota bacterium]
MVGSISKRRERPGAIAEFSRADWDRPCGLEHTNAASYRTNFTDYDLAGNKTGSNIVGLLSIPRGSIYNEGGKTSVVVRVEAHVRALTGSATDQGLANPNFAFSYLLVSEIIPFQYFAEDTT